jgi:hypothetical protein
MTESRLNPQIKPVQVGVRTLREVKIYPLSMTDQENLTKTLVGVFNDVRSGKLDPKDVGQEQVFDALQKLILDNIKVILKYVTDEGETPTMEELTNNQLFEITNIIFEVNYEGFLKNFKALIKRAKGTVIEEVLTGTVTNP